MIASLATRLSVTSSVDRTHAVSTGKPLAARYSGSAPFSSSAVRQLGEAASLASLFPSSVLSQG